jgi:hypothetical protein
MKIKGVSVKTTVDFVKLKFPAKFNEWLNALPPESSSILKNVIFANNWYPLHESVIVPMEFVAKNFYMGDKIKTAREIGIYSAEVALTGIYKVFVKIATPQFVLNRASQIFATYYDPSDIKIIESTANKAVLELSRFERKDELIMYRISGWVEKTLALTMKNPIKMDIKQVPNMDMLKFTITAEWK